MDLLNAPQDDPKPMWTRVQIYQARNGEYSWRAKAENWEIIFIPGQTFQRRWMAIRSARRCIHRMFCGNVRLIVEKN